MKVVSVKDFKNKLNSFIRDEIEKGEFIVLTKRKKPIALIKPFQGVEREAVIGYLMAEIGKLFKEADITEAEALNALEKVRKEIYGS